MERRSVPPESIDELLRFLPLFERPGRAFVVRWGGGDTTGDGAITMPFPVYAPDVDEFFRLASQECWMDPEYVSSGAGEMLQDDRLMEVATLPQIRAMLTSCVRAERFGDGNWDSLLRSGRVVALLRRLNALRGEMRREDEETETTTGGDTRKVCVKPGDHYAWGNGSEGWHLVNRPELAVMRERRPPGSAEGRHCHQQARQFFFVLSGEAVIEIGTVSHRLAPGEGLEIAPGVIHKLLNQGSVDLEYLVVSQPHVHGDRLLIRDEEGNL